MERKSVEREIQSDKEMGVERKDGGGKRKKKERGKRKKEEKKDKLFVTSCVTKEVKQWNGKMIDSSFPSIYATLLSLYFLFLLTFSFSLLSLSLYFHFFNLVSFMKKEEESIKKKSV